MNHILNHCVEFEYNVTNSHCEVIDIEDDESISSEFEVIISTIFDVVFFIIIFLLLY